jgi:CBS domain-containing protein
LRDRNLLSSTKDAALDAFQSMTENTTGRVLVLDFADPTKLLGVITKADLMHASSSIHRQMSKQRHLMSTNFLYNIFLCSAGVDMADLKGCPFGQDITDDCKNCDYGKTDHFDTSTGKCVKR